MAKRAITLILIVALAGAGYFLLSPEGRHLIDRAHIKLVRDDYQNRFRSGEKLPGTPDLARFDERLLARGVALGAPIYMRIFKLEFELELWVYKEGRFLHFATYPICDEFRGLFRNLLPSVAGFCGQAHRTLSISPTRK